MSRWVGRSPSPTRAHTKPRTCWSWAGLVSFVGVACALALPGHADGNAASFHRVRSPAPGDPESIGGYSAGCVRGAQPLPLVGPGYQVMRPERRRHFGHPALIRFVRELGRSAKADGLGPVYIGDLGQPRGGPAPDGHASHQTGLDVDIWYWSKGPAHKRLSPTERKATESVSALDESKELRDDLRARVSKLLRFASEDPRVARIFVNPYIKQALCAQAEGSRAWLSKLRPWWGHDEHFHVRLACPEGSQACEDQAPIASGDGCDELARWFAPEAESQRKKERARYRSKIGGAPRLPDACAALLEQPAK